MIGFPRVQRPVPATDAVLVVALAALSLAVPFAPWLDVGIVGSTTAQPPAGPGPLLVPVTAALVLPLLARRRLPGAVLLVVAGALVVRQESGLPPLAADFALLVALVAAGRCARGRQWWPVGAYAAHPLVAACLPGVGLRGWSLLVELLVAVVLPIGVGLALRARETPRAPDGDPGPRPPDPGLTAREVQVLSHVAVGRSNPEIAAALGISPETVKTHLGRARGKLGARDRTAAALRAADLGLLAPVTPAGDAPG